MNLYMYESESVYQFVTSSWLNGWTEFNETFHMGRPCPGIGHIYDSFYPVCISMDNNNHTSHTKPLTEASIEYLWLLSKNKLLISLPFTTHNF